MINGAGTFFVTRLWPLSSFLGIGVLWVGGIFAMTGGTLDESEAPCRGSGTSTTTTERGAVRTVARFRITGAHQVAPRHTTGVRLHVVRQVYAV
jgi:hypothetical protein